MTPLRSSLTARPLWSASGARVTSAQVTNCAASPSGLTAPESCICFHLILLPPAIPTSLNSQTEQPAPRISARLDDCVQPLVLVLPVWSRCLRNPMVIAGYRVTIALAFLLHGVCSGGETCTTKLLVSVRHRNQQRLRLTCQHRHVCCVTPSVTGSHENSANPVDGGLAALEYRRYVRLVLNGATSPIVIGACDIAWLGDSAPAPVGGVCWHQQLGAGRKCRLRPAVWSTWVPVSLSPGSLTARRLQSATDARVSSAVLAEWAASKASRLVIVGARVTSALLSDCTPS